jgi:hypothetical protein
MPVRSHTKNVEKGGHGSGLRTALRTFVRI